MFPITERFPSLVDWSKCKNVICYSRGNKDSEDASSILLQHIQQRCEPVFIDDNRDEKGIEYECTFSDNVMIYYIGAHVTPEKIVRIATNFTRIAIIDNNSDTSYAVKALKESHIPHNLYEYIDCTKTITEMTITFLGINSRTYSPRTLPAYGYCCAKKITIDNRVHVINDPLTTFGGLRRYIHRTFHTDKAGIPSYFRDNDALPDIFAICATIHNNRVIVMW
jgi:hypothetical protein